MSNVIEMQRKGNIWEKIGTNVKDCDTINEAFEKSNLNWDVVQKEVYTDVGKIQNTLANYRRDTNSFLGFINPRKYKVVQNIDAFNFVDNLDNFQFESTGCTSDYKKIWVVGKYNKEISIGGDSSDIIDTYITFLHGHDGKSGIRFFISPIRMWCTNQLNYMLNNCSFKHSITHTGDINFKMKSVQNAVTNTNIYMNSLQQEIDKQLDTKFSDNQIIDNISKLFEIKDKDSKRVVTRKQNSIDKVISIYKHTPNLQNYRRTGFGFINAISDFVSHREPNRKTSTFYENEFLSNLEGNDLIEQARQLVA